MVEKSFNFKFVEMQAVFSFINWQSEFTIIFYKSVYCLQSYAAIYWSDKAYLRYTVYSGLIAMIMYKKNTVTIT